MSKKERKKKKVTIKEFAERVIKSGGSCHQVSPLDIGCNRCPINKLCDGDITNEMVLEFFLKYYKKRYGSKELFEILL